MIKFLTESVARFLTKHNRRFDINDRSNADEVYLERYYLLFKNRPLWFPFNIFLHHFRRSDDHEFHDHPWNWGSLVLRGDTGKRRHKGATGEGWVAFGLANGGLGVDKPRALNDGDTSRRSRVPRII